MFIHSAALYDAIYGEKDYAREAQRVHALIQEHKRSAGNALLDVACGTGRHLEFLREQYAVEGLDLDSNLLAIARERLPGVEFHQADMVTFDLGRQYDVITCLFSAIAYVKTPARLEQTLQTMTRHVRPGGVVVVEPFIKPDAYVPGTVHANFVDRPDLKIARMGFSGLEHRVSVLDFHYLVATPAGIEHFTERHELALFTHDEYLAALRAVGLQAVYDPDGLIGRGLYIGILPDAPPEAQRP
jgi:ubiquinone/menaquinone biosynthesis C-methylase UbiE